MLEVIARKLRHVPFCARHYLAAKLSDSLEETPEERAARIVDVWAGFAEGSEFPVADVPTAWLAFVSRVNEGLSEFVVRLEFAGEVNLGGNEMARRWGEPFADLRAALCLQLYNAYVENNPVHVCPLCGRAFIRQQGRSLQNQRRLEGVMFCSRECAKNHANRAYRARQRAEKNGAQ